jgi:hypothetical protein
MNAVVRGVLVLAVALPLALFWQTWASANPSHIHYTTTQHHPATCVDLPKDAPACWPVRAAYVSTEIHYVNLAPYATPGEVAIALLGVALALSVVARQRKALNYTITYLGQ